MMRLEMDSPTELALAKLILKLKDWSYDIFSEGDYSDDMSLLTKWAKARIEEIENSDDET